jgi:hypothetical protein
MRLLAKGAIISLLSIAGAYGAACVSSPPPGESDGKVDPKLADVVFEGDATDDALATLLAVDSMPNVHIGPRITHPPTNAVMLDSEVVTFEWEADGSTALRLLPEERRLIPTWLTELLGPERAAQAAPVQTTGRGYYLLFSTDEDPRLLRVFTTKTTYKPDKKAWDILRSAGMWTKLTVTSAQFWDLAMLPGSGPYAGDPIEFCIEADGTTPEDM